EIARAFMVREATMAQRISRAKASIRDAGASFEMPEPGEEWAERLRSVLHVLYLMFNEGYASSDGPHLRRAVLSDEAIRLARALRERVPDHPEVEGLLALMLLTDARRAARTGEGGELVPLDEQDRALWDRERIDEGIALVSRALRRGAVGPYQLQAAINAVHAEAASFEEIDWPQILALYDLLLRMTDNPMVALNRAVAAAMVHGPEHALELLDRLDEDPRLNGHHRLDAVRAHLYDRAGDHDLALAHYRAAARGTRNPAERNYLTLRAARLQARS
ncbi:MAG: RNA polymerase sigma factor, partial [Gemmatimonadota bacterium]